MKTTKTLVALAAFCLLLTNANAQSFLTNGLVAFYPLNGSTNEATGSGYNLTNFGAQLTADRFGNSNSAYLFNGSSYMISATNYTLPSGTTNRTLSLWVKADASITNTSGTYVVADFGSGASPNKAFGLFLQSGLWGIHFDGANQQVFSNVKPDNSWHQFVCIYSNGFAQMFVDGNLKTNAAWSTTTAVGRLIIGNNINGFSEYFRGIIDEVRIYNRAMSTNEVAQLYAVELKSPPLAGIAIYSNSPVIYFPTSPGTNFNLQMATNLNSPVWVTVTNAEPFSGYRVTNTPSNAFFRLNGLP